MCRSHGTQSNASLKVAGFDRSFNRSSLAGFHRSLTPATEIHESTKTNHVMV
jgi:hypothetical protein